MQKIKVGLLMIGMCASSFFVKVVKGAENGPNLNSKVYVAQKADEIYNQINFGDDEPLSKEVFRSAYTGFLNLKAAGKLNAALNGIITICDFSLSSNVKRLWVINLQQSKILFHSLVAHGQGTGEEFAEKFSNNDNSHQSSLGFYVTDDTYNGDNGYSLKLRGMDAGYNDAAYNRSIVVHGADYVCESYIRGNQRLGRSWGCPAVPRAISAKLINTIKNGTCLYIYYPSKNYLNKSVWLNKTPPISDDDFLKQQLEKSHIVPAANTAQKIAAVTPAPPPVDPNTYQGVKLAVGGAQQ